MNSNLSSPDTCPIIQSTNSKNVSETIFDSESSTSEESYETYDDDLSDSSEISAEDLLEELLVKEIY